MFEKRNYIQTAATVAALALSSAVSATETVHFLQNFTDGSLVNAGPEVGSLAEGNPAVSLQTQEAWRNPAQTYYGWAKASAFDGPVGFAAGFTSTALTLANTPILNAGNVWVLDASMISDVATTGGQFYNSAPGVIIEPHPFSGSSGLVTKLSPAVSNGSNAEGMILANAYPDGADNTVQPTTLGNSLAGVGTSLDGVLRAKYVFQGVNADADTRVSTQVLNGNTPAGTAAKTDGGAFRTSYATGTGLMFQFIKGHPGTNVSYATGVPDASTGGADKTDVPYVEAATNLQMGLTQVTFKQVRQGDFNTDGVVDVSSDFVTWNSNRGAVSGKSFFDGDANGDGAVDVSSDFVIWNSQRGTDLVGPNVGLAEYDPSTGIVKVSTNGATFIEINSAAGNLITANAVPLLSVPNALFQDPPTSSKINYAGINALGTGGFLDDFSLGAILPLGLSSNDGLTFRWSNPGVPAQTIPVTIVPEPSGIILVGLAGLGFVRRRRVAA